MLRSEFLSQVAQGQTERGTEAEVQLLVRLLGRLARDPQLAKKMNYVLHPPPARHANGPEHPNPDAGPDRRGAFKRSLAASLENLLGGRKVSKHEATG